VDNSDLQIKEKITNL